MESEKVVFDDIPSNFIKDQGLKFTETTSENSSTRPIIINGEIKDYEIKNKYLSNYLVSFKTKNGYNGSCNVNTKIIFYNENKGFHSSTILDGIESQSKIVLSDERKHITNGALDNFNKTIKEGSSIGSRIFDLLEENMISLQPISLPILNTNDYIQGMNLGLKLYKNMGKLYDFQTELNTIKYSNLEFLAGFIDIIMHKCFIYNASQNIIIFTRVCVTNRDVKYLGSFFILLHNALLKFGIVSKYLKEIDYTRSVLYEITINLNYINCINIKQFFNLFDNELSIKLDAKINDYETKNINNNTQSNYYSHYFDTVSKIEIQTENVIQYNSITINLDQHSKIGNSYYINMGTYRLGYTPVENNIKKRKNENSPPPTTSKKRKL